VTTEHAQFAAVETESRERTRHLLSIGGKRSADSIHRELGLTMWNLCGMSRSAKGLQDAIARVRELRAEFWENLRVPGRDQELNQSLEHAGRVADFLEFAELTCVDALQREESCGGHFREEHQTPDNEAKRNDKDFAFAAAFEFQGLDRPATLHKEPLAFEVVKPTTRSYA
jgi:succinate dehydrogenase / fumarate reductase flavoprotein subunit